jgi:hypothetical protein
MVAKRLILSVVVAVTILAVAPATYGQGLGLFGGNDSANSEWAAPGGQGFWMALGVRKYINSFSSYEFPNPFGPQDPLSRLEWPWEQVFGVAKAGWAFRTFELKMEYASTALLPSGLKAQDSDWEDPNHPNQKTTFSQGKAKPRGWTFDLSTTIPVPAVSNVKGIVGYRKQQFKFTYTDVLQSSIWDGAGYIPVVRGFFPGAGIEFSQYFTHWYVGGVTEWTFDPSQYFYSCSSPLFPCLVLRLQADVGYATATNHDQHLLRTVAGVPQDRHSYEDSRGSSWHVNGLVGIYAGCEKNIRLDIEADFIRIKTTGSHQLTQSPAVINLTWSGADVWSDQAYVGISGRYYFATTCGWF